MELIVDKDIRNLQTKQYTEDRETRYRKHYKALKQFFENLNIDNETPAFLDLLHQVHSLTCDIDYILEKYKVFDSKCYIKLLETFKEILKYKDSSDQLTNLLDYLHL